MDGKEVIVYLDDILILSKTMNEHLCSLGLIFGRIRDSGLNYAEKSRLLESLCGKNNEKLVWSKECLQNFKRSFDTNPNSSFSEFQ